MDPDELIGIDAWLNDQGLQSASPGRLLQGFCKRLCAAGLPLTRGSIGSDTLHPVVAGVGFVWRQGHGVRREDYARTSGGDADTSWQASPFRQIHQTRATELRRALVAPTFQPDEFPLLARFRDEGGRDYLALASWFGRNATLGELDGAITSWITDRPTGFADAEIEALRRLVPHLALAYKAMMTIYAGRALVETYLGRHAGRRVLKGAIARGEAEQLRTVLWYSDLVGFTKIADDARLPEDREALVALLNDYSDGLVSAIRPSGGHVVKFMGDGILATFPTADDDVAACGRALAAARAACTAIAALKGERAAAGVPITDFYLALHIGDVAYGNVGAAERLDFTVVGPAVNEVARIEAMCRAIDQPILVSAAFAEAAGPHRAGLVSVGRYALRGIARPQELFTLDPDF